MSSTRIWSFPSGKRVLLASTAIASVLFAAPAVAACNVTASPNSVVCATDTVTTDTTNTNAATTPSIDRLQTFNTGGNVSGSISSGVTIGGFGLSVQTTENGAGVSFTNNGAVNQATSVAGGSGALQLATTSGPVIYNSASGAGITGVATSALNLQTGTGDITANINGDISNVGGFGPATGVTATTSGTGSILINGTGNISGVSGIVAVGDGDITINGTGNVSYSSISGNGIEVDHGANAGTVTINRTGTITGPGGGLSNNAGIRVTTSGTGGVFVTDVGAISNVRFGIYGDGFDNFTVTPGGAISASNSGILLQTQGTGSATVNSGFDITSPNVGVSVASVGTGAGTVNVTGGVISGGGRGVNMASNGLAPLSFTQTGGTVLSSTGTGVNISSGGGDILVNQTGGSIGLPGAPAGTNGLSASTSGGRVDVTSAAVYATGIAVVGQTSGAGTVRVVSNGPVNSVNGSGLQTTAATGATTIVNNASTTAGTPTNGVVRATSTTGTIAITNNATGTIASNLASPETRLAIVTAGGPTTLVNNGTLTGLLALGNATNAVTNTGTWTSTGVNDFGTGATTINNSGTLNIGGGSIFNGTALTFINSAGTTTNAGAINGDVLVTGGALTGSGSVANLTIGGGVFAPGNGTAGSATTVSGNLAFQSAATYRVLIDPTTSSLVNVTGTATLGGAAVNAVYANGSYINRQYTILNAAGGVSGTFAGPVNTNLPTNFTSSLGYDATHAYLNLALNFTPPVMPPGGPIAPVFTPLNINQTNVATTLVNFFNRTGGIPLAFGGLSPAGLTQVSGEVGTGTQQATFDAMGLFMGLLTDPFVAGRGDGAASQGAFGYADEVATGFAGADLSYAAKRKNSDAMAAIYRKAPPLIAQPLQRWSVWSAGFGGSQTTDGNATLGSNSATSRIYGGAVGLDYRFSPDTVAGVALAGGGTNFSVANSGTGRSDLFQAGAFVRHTVGATYLTAALAYGWQDVTTDRSVGADRLNARFTTDAVSGRIEAGHRLLDPTFGIGITPYAAGQVTTVYLPDYRETSGVANTFGLNYAGRDVTASRSELGLRTDKSYGVSDGVLTLRGRAAWAHNFNPDRSIAATFQTLPGASFVVGGAAQARDAALVTASAEMKWRNNWAVAATFEGEFSDVTRSYAGKGVVKYAW